MHSILPERVTLAPSHRGGAATPPISRLPDDILREGAQRLGSAGLLYSITFLFAWLGPAFISGILSPAFFLGPRSLASIVSRVIII